MRAFVYVYRTHASTHIHTKCKEIRSLTQGCQVTTGLHTMRKKNAIVDCDAEVKRTDSILCILRTIPSTSL